MAKIVVDFVAKTGLFKTDTERSRRHFERQMKQIERSAKETGKTLGIAFAIAATAVTAITKAAINSADELSKMSRSVGVSVETLSTLGYAAERSGVDVDALGKSLVKLAKNASDTARGTGEAIHAFAAMGIQVTDTEGNLKNTDKLLVEIAEKFSTYGDSANKTALAVNIFGRAGAQLIPLLNNGAKGIDELTKRAKDLGLELDTKTAQKAEEFNDLVEDLGSLAKGAALDIARDLLPALTELSRKFVDSGIDARKGRDGTNLFSEGLKTVIRFAIETIGWFKKMGATFGAIATQVGTLGRGISDQFGNLKQLQSDIFEIGPVDAYTKFVSSGFDTAAKSIGRAKGNIDALSDTFSDIDFETLSRLQALDTVSIDNRGGSTSPSGNAPAIRDVNKARAAATKAAADQERAEAALTKELQRQAEARNQALIDWSSLTATLSGPLAEAENDHIHRLQDIEEIGREAGKSAAEVSRLRELEVERYNKVTDAIKAQKSPMEQLLADLAFEAKLLNLTGIEREKAILLRDMDAESIAKYGDDVSASLQKIADSQKVIDGMDAVRDSTRGLFSDLAKGTKSVSDAFNDFFDNLYDRITDMVTNRFVESLFGANGSTSGGASGNVIGSLFGAFFGGAKASGGPVYSGKAYLVGERGPELFTPPGNGHIVPNGKMGGGMTINQTINVAESTDRRSASQVGASILAGAQRAMVRNR